MPTALAPLDDDFAPTRDALHAVAEQVLSAARYRVTGRIGLRVAPEGFGTPPFGGEVLRVQRVDLVHERDGVARRTTLSTLAAAAAFADVPLGAPPVYPAATAHVSDAPLRIEPQAAEALATWLAFADSRLDAVRSRFAGQPTTAAQLWPEHFDLAIELGDEASGRRANWGASPGDGTIPTPYLYVGPWDATRRTGRFAEYDFGAAITYDELRSSADPDITADAFFDDCATALFDLSL